MINFRNVLALIATVAVINSSSSAEQSIVLASTTSVAVSYTHLCHQAEQDSEFFGIGTRRGPRSRRHDRDESEPDRERYRQHDPVRGLEADIDQIDVCRRLGSIILVVIAGRVSRCVTAMMD